jgi:hypothetical protein
MKPKRRRLTQAEFDAELQRARLTHMVGHNRGRGELDTLHRMIARTGRRKSWWQRGWKR